MHLAVADDQGRTFGGHLAEGCTVRTTAEVILATDDRLVFAHEHHRATGDDELVVREPNPCSKASTVRTRKQSPAR